MQITIRVRRICAGNRAPCGGRRSTPESRLFRWHVVSRAKQTDIDFTNTTARHECSSRRTRKLAHGSAKVPAIASRSMQGLTPGYTTTHEKRIYRHRSV